MNVLTKQWKWKSPNSLQLETVRIILQGLKDGKLTKVDQLTSQPTEAEESTQEESCIYQAEDPKDHNYVWCGNSRIPRSVCTKRKARYAFYSHNCKPTHIISKREDLNEEEEKPKPRIDTHALVHGTMSPSQEEEWRQYARAINNRQPTRSVAKHWGDF